MDRKISKKPMSAYQTEAVECCPHCDRENVFQNHSVKKLGYVVKCQQCEKEIFLCDECSHGHDNPKRKCDWKETEDGSVCFRGKCTNNKQ